MRPDVEGGQLPIFFSMLLLALLEPVASSTLPCGSLVPANQMPASGPNAA